MILVLNLKSYQWYKYSWWSRKIFSYYLKNTDQIEEYFNFQESNYTDINFINLDEGLKLLLQSF